MVMGHRARLRRASGRLRTRRCNAPVDRRLVAYRSLRDGLGARRRTGNDPIGR